MENDATILVMAGAREAHGVITGLVARRRRVIASLPEPERMFDTLPVHTRIGHFQDAEALTSWFCEKNVTCVIDASHAFDNALSDQAAAVCRARKLRYLRVLRPPWEATSRDSWTLHASVRDAAMTLSVNARAFSNTGRASLPELADFPGKVLYLRQTQEPSDPPPYEFVKYIVGTPPFSQKSEQDLFKDLRISRLICRNVGGAASKSKLLAARGLGIRVSMIERPASPEGMPLVTSVEEAIAWEANP